MPVLDWNRERYRTRDRLLEYDDTIVPLYPHSAGLPIIYPWESDLLKNIVHQFFLMAAASGYTGSEETFMTSFGYLIENEQIIFSSFDEFPESGDNNHLYFDTQENIMYAYVNNEYQPLNELLIKDTILNGGNAGDI